MKYRYFNTNIWGNAIKQIKFQGYIYIYIYDLYKLENIDLSLAFNRPFTNFQACIMSVSKRTWLAYMYILGVLVLMIIHSMRFCCWL